MTQDTPWTEVRLPEDGQECELTLLNGEKIDAKFDNVSTEGWNDKDDTHWKVSEVARWRPRPKRWTRDRQSIYTPDKTWFAVFANEVECQKFIDLKNGDLAKPPARERSDDNWEYMAAEQIWKESFATDADKYVWIGNIRIANIIREHLAKEQS